MSVLAKAEARKILKEYFITEPQKLNLEDILVGEMIYLEESELNEESGRIVFNKNCGIMRINKNIKELGQKRIVIAHELGHFKLHNNKDSGCTKLELLTHNKNLLKENEANIFAAELLMPEEWIRNFIKGKKNDKGLLSDFCNYFKVSISSAALRISTLDIFPIAVVFSKNAVVEWSSISNSFPFKWIPKGYKVNNNSYAFDIFNNFYERKKKLSATESSISDNILFTNDLSNEINSVNEVLADAWFWEDRNYKKNFIMYEYNIPMPNYNSVLTILTLKEQKKRVSGKF